MAREGDGERGVATLLLPMLVWFATLVAVFAIDLGAYLVAASRAQALADAAALAAVAGAAGSGAGARAASRVVAAAGGRLEECACGGAGRAEVVVSVAVPGLLMPSLGAARVRARSEARLVP